MPSAHAAGFHSSSTTRVVSNNTLFLSCNKDEQEESLSHSLVDSITQPQQPQQPTQQQPEVRSVLVVGATGRAGLACIRALAGTDKGHPSIRIHAFCRHPEELELHDAVLCESVIAGDATDPRDLEFALDQTRANTVLICLGSRPKDGKPTVRTDNAHAMVQVLKGGGSGGAHSHHHHHTNHRHHTERRSRHTSRGSRDKENKQDNKARYRNIHVIVLSHSGSQSQSSQRRISTYRDRSSSSKRFQNRPMRKVFHRCHADHARTLEDHWGQENHFQTLKAQTTVVRPAVLTQGCPKGHLASFCKRSANSSRSQQQLELEQQQQQRLLGLASDNSNGFSNKQQQQQQQLQRRQSSSSLLIEMTDLADLASWVVEEVVTQKHQGQTVNVCSCRSKVKNEDNNKGAVAEQ